MTNEALVTIAEQRGYKIIYAPLEENRSFSIEDERCYVLLSKRLSNVKEKEHLAHELGHCEYGGFYNRHSRFDIRGKAERRADKWAYLKLLPPGEIMSAFRRGVCETWELAELFDVSCEYMQNALNYYRSVMVI